MTRRLWCEQCRDWTRANLDGTNPMCQTCGERGYEIDNDGHCLRQQYNAGQCPAPTGDTP